MKTLLLLVTFVLLASCQSQPGTAADGGGTGWSCLQYPGEAVTCLEEAGLTEQELTDRANAGHGEYVQCSGYEDIGGIMHSPYYKARVNGKDIPVYASMVFIRSANTGTLHSFSEVYIEPGSSLALNVELEGTSVKLHDALVLPKSLGTEARCSEGVASATITRPGIYTFLFNGAQQYYGYTLMVREKTDEEAEIAQYVRQYGKDNVKVFEPGLNELDYLNYVGKDSLVVYLKQGAYLKARHKYEIGSLEDEGKWVEREALTSNEMQLARVPFVNFYKCRNIVLTGRGVLDMTSLDRRERKGVVFNFCENVSVSSVKIINAPEWSFITYCCRNVTIDRTDILGYRGNADGFAICNTHNATVSNCFVRTADDEFEVKALGGPMDTRNVTFTDCIAWGGYARCFGVCGEVCKGISNVTFRNSAVIYRDGVWDNDRIGALVITAEQCMGSVNGITFENIEVFRDEGRAVLVKIYDRQEKDFSIGNVVFRNIEYNSPMPSKIEGNDHWSNRVQVTFENITANGKRLDSAGNAFQIGANCEVTFSE